MQNTSILERLQLLEHRAALDDLVKTYFLASDDDNPELLGSLFAPESEFLVSGASCGRSPQAIVDFITAERTKMGLTNHVLDSALFQIHGEDRATGIIRAHLEIVYLGVCLFGAVRYIDDYVRPAGSWLIQRREMRVLYMAPQHEVGAAMASETPVRWPGQAATASDLPRSRPS